MGNWKIAGHHGYVPDLTIVVQVLRWCGCLSRVDAGNRPSGIWNATLRLDRPGQRATARPSAASDHLVDLVGGAAQQAVGHLCFELCEVCFLSGGSTGLACQDDEFLGNQAVVP